MSRIRILVGLAAFVSASFAAAPAGAANSATFRDCAFVGGIDPDFVQLSGATEGPPGSLTVSASQSQVQLVASESADSGDSSGADTLSATVTAPNVPAKTVSGSGTGKVTLSIPLAGAGAGAGYTIAWSATFDNAMHQCPSALTPQNTAASPFVLAVSADTPVTPITPVAPLMPVSPAVPPAAVTPKRRAKSKCHNLKRRAHGHRRVVRVCSKHKTKPKKKSAY